MVNLIHECEKMRRKCTLKKSKSSRGAVVRGGEAVRVGICRHKKMLASLSHGS